MVKRTNIEMFGPNPLKGRVFPRDLAKLVSARWNFVVAGDYVTPACPPEKMLREVFEVSYLTSSAPEEDRFPKFNVVCLPSSFGKWPDKGSHRWRFIEGRPLSVSELRRLAPAADLRKSAIWLEWNDSSWTIAGLIDLGTSWSRARAGLEYHYYLPPCLLIEIDRPGRLQIYQGQYHVATLSDGTIERPYGMQIHLSLHEPAIRGLRAMDGELVRPTIEHPKEFQGFEFLAIWNTYAAIANSISLAGHGGALVIVPSGAEIPKQFLRIKYPLAADVLRSSLVGFINARHVMGDLMARSENKEAISDEKFSHASLKSREAFSDLVESTRFVAQLSACDGAIVIADDLRLLGFGVEISAELKGGMQVYDVGNEWASELRPLDVEQFGMRHRSAIKLISQQTDFRALVISQDGPISAIFFGLKKISFALEGESIS